MTFSRVKALMGPANICFGILPVCENSGLVQDYGVVLREREEGCFFFLMKVIDSTPRKENPGLVGL